MFSFPGHDFQVSLQRDGQECGSVDIRKVEKNTKVLKGTFGNITIGICEGPRVLTSFDF